MVETLSQSLETALNLTDGTADIVREQIADQGRVVGVIGLEIGAVRARALYRALLDRDLGHAAAVAVLEQLVHLAGLGAFGDAQALNRPVTMGGLKPLFNPTPLV